MRGFHHHSKFCSVRRCRARGKSSPGVVSIHQDMLHSDMVTATLEDRAWCRDAALSCGVQGWLGQQGKGPSGISFAPIMAH